MRQDRGLLDMQARRHAMIIQRVRWPRKKFQRYRAQPCERTEVAASRIQMPILTITKPYYKPSPNV
jgi:hypothetical protein